MVFIEMYLQAIITWIAIDLEVLHERHFENESLRTEIESLQKIILESERYTLVSLNKKTINNLRNLINFKQLEFL